MSRDHAQEDSTGFAPGSIRFVLEGPDSFDCVSWHGCITIYKASPFALLLLLQAPLAIKINPTLGESMLIILPRQMLP